MASRSFLLTHTFKDVSKLEEGGSYYSDIYVRHDIPWKIRVFKKDGFLGANLHCEKKECSETKKWSFQTKFTLKLVAVGGKFFQRTVQHEFQKPEGHGMDKFISWENMQRDYVEEDSIIIEIHADIVSSSGVFEEKCLPYLPADSGKSFVLKHTFKKLSRYSEGEYQYSDVEVHYNIPWKIELQKENGSFGFHLPHVSEDRTKTGVVEREAKLIAANGKFHSVPKRRWKLNSTSGRAFLIYCNGIEKDYLINDSIDVEVRVKIIEIKDVPCTLKSFDLSHTIKNLSSIKEGGNIFTGIQTRFNIPWRMKIEKQNGFLGLYLHREKKIEIDFQLKLVSPNGKSLSIERCSGYGWDMFLRWDVLEEDYIVNDTIVLEARVWIRKMTGVEGDVEKFPGFVIPVGDREYSMEKWLEMAFDH
ncbi:MATH domain-containing protein [Caenorhabditis elegans]|uniref:MATH domain-containing protein n=1 Tax=Caenorhabditis elegans TaxID=6239 RepID=O16561_CAEEL|nr:MATH domain-containing protein [Caenorhabditis elegans]CCD64675.2 MATH domain-containing protein [Caenorhabditis elegans]